MRPTLGPRTNVVAITLLLTAPLGGCRAVIEPEGPWESVWCNLDNLCAIDAAGVPTCWSESFSERVLPTSTRIVEVSSGLENACGVDSDGEMQCWTLGGTPDPEHGTDELVFSLSGSCALRVDGGPPECWDGRGNLFGFDPSRGRHSQLLISWGINCMRTPTELYCTERGSDSVSGIVGLLAGEFIDMAGSGETLCGLRNGEVICAPSTGAPAGNEWTQLAGRHGTQCAIDSMGRTECWGSGGAAVSPLPPLLSTCDGGGNWRCGVELGSQELACWGLLPDWLQEFEVPTAP